MRETMNFTQRNPDGKTFRAPAERIGEFRMLQIGGSIALYGDVIDRLGQYEAALSVEEAESYARRK